jgi:hypothetical protein
VTPSTDGRSVAISCPSDCNYLVVLERGAGVPVRAPQGSLDAGGGVTVSAPASGLQAGDRLSARAASRRDPATEVVREAAAIG